MDALKSKAEALLNKKSGSSTTDTTGDAAGKGYAAEGKELYSDYSSGNQTELQKDAIADGKNYMSGQSGATGGATSGTNAGVGQGFTDGNMGASGV